MAVELSRDVTFGQYLDLPSPIHHLDPRTKLTGALLMITALLLSSNYPSMGIFFMGLIPIHLLSRVPTGYALRGLRLLLIPMTIISIFQILFYRSLTFEQSLLWQWGILSISVEAILRALLNVLRVVLLYDITSMLMFTTGLVDLADGMEVMLNPLKRVGVPVNEAVMVSVVAFKFVPILIAELERLIKAQAARGQRFNQGNLIDRARAMGNVLVPLFVSAFQRADALSIAMDARCYRGGQGRTKRRVLTMQRADWLGLVYAVGVAVVTVVGPQGVTLLLSIVDRQ